MRVLLWVALVVLSTEFFARAQSPASLPPQTTSGTGFTGAPYSGRETTVRIDPPSRGGRTSTSVTLLWRDAQGRTRQERPENGSPGSAGRSIIIIDPAAGVYLKWSEGAHPGHRTYTIWPVTAAQRVTAPAARTANDSSAGTDSRSTDSLPLPCGVGCFRFVRQPEVVNGVAAECSRTTRIVRADAGDHIDEFTTENEVCVSTDLSIIVHHTMKDAHLGSYTTDVTNVVRGDPDPALFVPPAGYEAKDMRAQGER